MRQHIDDAQPHQRREPDRPARVVGKDEEGAAVRNEAAVERKAVHRGRHAELAHPVMDVAAFEFSRRDDAHALREREHRMSEIGRAADRRLRRDIDDAERVLGGFARRELRLLLRRGLAQRLERRGDSRRDIGFKEAREVFLPCPRPQKVSSQAARTGAPRAPARRQPSRMDWGTSKGGCSQPSALRAKAFSSAPKGEPCTPSLPCLLGAP